MGWFKRRNREPERVDEILDALRALGVRLTEVEARAQTPAPAVTAPPPLPPITEPLVRALTAMVGSQLELTNKMMERTYRQQLSTSAQEMGRRGKAKAMENLEKRRAAETPPGMEHAILNLEEVKKCEECAARLEGRAAHHSNHLFRHNTEAHETLVLPLVRSNGNNLPA
jgi:hypothetical protein